MAELGNLIYPPEKNVIPGTFCFQGIHREMSFREMDFWMSRGLPAEGGIHKAPRKVSK